MSAKFVAISVAIALQLGAIVGLILIVNKDNSSVHEQLNSAPNATSLDEDKNNTPRLAMTGSGWRLVEQFSAHYALILEVEAENLSDAKSIAQQLAEPVQSTGYVEVNLRSQ